MLRLLPLLLLLLTLTIPAAALAHKADNADQELSLMQMTDGNTLYVVGYAHLDTQWRWAYPEVIRDFIPNTLHGNFRLLEKYPEYIFNFSGSRRYEMMREYYPEGYEQLKQYIAAGRWFPCGSSVDECDANVPSAESFIRQVLYGNHYFRSEFGVDSAEFMLPDCFGFPASIPSMLHHCGIKGFSTQKLSWGSASGIPFNVGVWEGLDGSSIVVAALNPGAYVGKVEENLASSEKWNTRIADNGAASGLFADYHYFGTGDVGGAPEENSVAFIQQGAESSGPVKVISGTAEQMFLDITPEKLAGLPRYRGDLLLTEHSAGSITSQAYMKRLNRKNELLADAAEKAAAAAQWMSGAQYPTGKLNAAWGLLLGSQMHDILPGTSIPKAYEYSWNDEILASNQFADVLESSAATVAAGLDTSSAGQAVVVYNPLGIAREDVVEATVRFSGRIPKALRVLGPDGSEVMSQTITSGSGIARILFVAKVEPVSFSVFQVVEGAANIGSTSWLRADEHGLQNKRYKVKLNNHGDVASIFDAEVNRELLSAPARLAITEDSPGYWPAWNIDWDDQSAGPRSHVSGKPAVRVVDVGPVRATVEVTREHEGSTYVQRISLAAGDAGNRVTFDNTIDWRGRSCNLKAEFPLTASNPQATYNWEAGTIMRGNNDEKKYEVPHHQWFDLTDASGDFGVSVLSPCKYGSDKPADNLLRLTLLRTPGPVVDKEGKPRDDYADQCSQDWGRHEITYALAGHSGDWRDGDTQWQAMRAEQPLIAFNAPQHDGMYGRSFSLVSVSDPRVRIMALKKAEDSDELMVRLVELSGEAVSNVRLEFPVPIVAAREVTGQELPLPGGRADIEDGGLVTDMSGYSLRSFAVTLAAPEAAAAVVRSSPVELPWNNCAATSDGEMATGGMDRAGRSLAAEMLPGELVDGGVRFKLAPAGGGRRNAVACDGQVIDLPMGSSNRAYILAASSPGVDSAEFTVEGQPVMVNVQDWGGFVGQWDNRVWEGEIPEQAFNWPWKPKSVTPAYTRRAPVAWFASHRHNADGMNDIYEYTYLYRYAIELPPGARQLVLPVNPAINVLALSVADDPRAGFSPAQPLYDTLEGHPGFDL